MLDSLTLLRAMNGIHEEDVVMAGKLYSKNEKNGNIRKRIVTLALAAALLLALGVKAWAVYRGRVQDLVMKSSDAEEIALAGEEDADVVLVGEETDGDGESVPAEPEEPHAVPYDPLADGYDMISLQGYAGSPEYQAALAWAEFLHGYDRDGAVLASVGNAPTPWTEIYGANGYNVYSQEMADRIESIAAEYGLSFHSGFTSASVDELRSRFGDFCSEIRDGYGYCYADGTFQCDCDNGKGMFQIRRCMKGVLDTIGLNVGDADQYEQWEYQTACGETVLLALAPHHALILAESEQSFTVVSVMAGSDPGLSGAVISAAELEALADSIDFSVL